MAKKKQDELEELENSYRQLAGEPKKKRKKSGGIVALVSLAILLLAVIVGYGMIWGSFLDSFLTMPSVTVAGLDLSGMNRKEAKEALAQLDYANSMMAVTVEDSTLVLTGSEAGLNPDWNTAVNQAWFLSEGGVFDISPYLGLNTEAVRKLTEEFGQLYNSEVVKSTFLMEGELPSLEMGKEDDASAMSLVVTIGQPGYYLDTDALYEAILAGYYNGDFNIEGQYVFTEPEWPTAQELFERYAIAPTEAAVDPETFKISPELYGFGFDVAKAQEQMDSAQYGQTLRFEFARISPTITKAQLEAELFKDVLGECKTPYSGADNNNRNTNLYLACKAMNGVIVYPGETFSYNDTLGERTAERGWKPAASYAANGLTVDTYGGGICQGSSTLYLACLLADVEIVERYAHGYISSYIAPGMDASVNWGTADFRFKNNFNYPIRIEAFREKGYLQVRLLGTDEKDYYIEMTYQTLSSKAYETVYEEVKEKENPKGYKDGQVLVTPYTGYSVKTYKVKFDKATKEKLETNFEAASNYSHRDQVIVKIIPDKPAADETVPDNTTPEASAPETTTPENNTQENNTP